MQNKQITKNGKHNINSYALVGRFVDKSTAEKFLICNFLNCNSLGH